MGEESGDKDGGKEFAHVMFMLMGKGLARGWFRGHPHEVVPTGLGGEVWAADTEGVKS